MLHVRNWHKSTKRCLLKLEFAGFSLKTCFNKGFMLYVESTGCVRNPTDIELCMLFSRKLFKLVTEDGNLYINRVMSDETLFC
jgi:hypothetical protein